MKIGEYTTTDGRNLGYRERIYLKICKYCGLRYEENDYSVKLKKSHGLRCKKGDLTEFDSRLKCNSKEYHNAYAKEYRKNNRLLLRERNRERRMKFEEKYMKAGFEKLLKHIEELAKKTDVPFVPSAPHKKRGKRRKYKKKLSTVLPLDRYREE